LAQATIDLLPFRKAFNTPLSLDFQEKVKFRIDTSARAALTDGLAIISTKEKKNYAQIASNECQHVKT
jgi:hypothetical protein